MADKEQELKKEYDRGVLDAILFIESNIPTICPLDKKPYILKCDFDRVVKELKSRF